MLLIRQIGTAFVLLILPLVAAWRNCPANHLHKARCGTRNLQAQPASLCRASRATYDGANRAAVFTGSIVGMLLSLALLLVMGIRVVFFGEQLRDGWLSRRRAAVTVAHAGPARKHHRCLDVRIFRKPSVLSAQG